MTCTIKLYIYFFFLFHRATSIKKEKRKTLRLNVMRLISHVPSTFQALFSYVLFRLTVSFKASFHGSAGFFSSVLFDGILQRQIGLFDSILWWKIGLFDGILWRQPLLLIQGIRRSLHLGFMWLSWFSSLYFEFRSVSAVVLGTFVFFTIDY